MSDISPLVSTYLAKPKKWEKETEELHEIILDCGLAVSIKWGKLCYDLDGKNIVVIQPFKDYCGLLFLKGVLMEDPEGILQKTGENTIVGRQMRFVSLEQIRKSLRSIKAYVVQAIEIEKKGLKIDTSKIEPLPYPEEFKKVLDEMPDLKIAFDALTPGRQKAYIIHFSIAKNSSTRAATIEKFIPQILEGKGMNDRP